jgi:hypothetical protein
VAILKADLVLLNLLWPDNQEGSEKQQKEAGEKIISASFPDRDHYADILRNYAIPPS